VTEVAAKARRWLPALVVAGMLAPAACGDGGAGVAEPGRYHKVMLVVEENHTYDQVLGAGAAPFLRELADRYGVTTRLATGYPIACPSLPSYLILTSGDDHGICDDQAPASHHLGGDSVFAQVRATGRQWRVYAESMPVPCDAHNSGRYVVRHTAAPYYTGLSSDCPNWDLPMGTFEHGALHDDLTAGQLPAFSLVTPDICDDMHGGEGCPPDLVRAGDDWLRRLVGLLEAAPDWTSGQLAVVIAWDEGSRTDNHVPALVVSPTTSRVTLTRKLTNCAILRLISDVLTVKPLGCAGRAPALRAAFGMD